MNEPEFLAAARRNPFVPELERRLRDIGLPQGHLTAGCLFQPVWNGLAGRPPEEGIKDYDVFYFDGTDLSWEAEDRVIRRVAARTADLPVEVEVRNQARVHLWYAAKFGGTYPRLTSARDGIDRYLVACTCVGIELETGQVHAPDGFGDLARGILRMNPRYSRPALFREKAGSYRSRWPWLTIVP